MGRDVLQDQDFKNVKLVVFEKDYIILKCNNNQASI